MSLLFPFSLKFCSHVQSMVLSESFCRIAFLLLQVSSSFKQWKYGLPISAFSSLCRFMPNLFRLLYCLTPNLLPKPKYMFLQMLPFFFLFYFFVFVPCPFRTLAIMALYNFLFFVVIVDFIFLLSLRNLTLPSIYTGLLGKLCAAFLC